MSETLFRFLLSDLKTIRLACKCGMILEIPLDKMAILTEPLSCPMCKQPFTDPSQGNVLYQLARFITFTNGLSTVKVEFTLPEKTPPEKTP